MYIMRRFNSTKCKVTKESDVKVLDNQILNPKNSIVNTNNGDDKIIGNVCLNGDFSLGVFVEAASRNFNSIIASDEFIPRTNIDVKGIQNQGIINTGAGNDIVSGTAIANLSATVTAQAIAFAQNANTSVITNALASIEFYATADGIDNSGGEINTGQGNDSIYGSAIGSVAADAIAYADASAIAEAMAGATATSLAKATITVTGIKNIGGKITTGDGNDTITAFATSSCITSSVAASSTLSSGNSDDQALAEAVSDAFAEAKDTAIAIDNTGGLISTGKGNDTIIAKATGSESYGIFGGSINMGKGDDRLEASSLGGGVNINMNDGKDYVEGFGNATIDGGKDYDILSFGSYSKSDFNIYSQNSFTIFELGGVSMKTHGFEEFKFAEGSYNSSDL
jgi:hypothetical protein